MIKRLTAVMLAAVLMMSCVPSWAEEAKTVEPTGGETAAAVVSDIFYIPGKAGTCVTSGALWTVAMVLSAGTLYRQAGDFVYGACTGKWVLTGADFAGPAKPVDM